MTLGEQLELAIYRFVESVGKGQGRSVEMPVVANLVPGADNVDAADALIRLHDDGYVSLVKYDIGPNPVSYTEMGRARESFFYRGSLRVTVTPRGRLDFERKQTAIPAEVQPPPKKGKRQFHTALNVYEDQGLLGEGGSGTVHRVSDNEGNSYALKLLREECLGGKRQKRFQSELRFSMKAPHPNIVPVIDHGLFGSDGCPFFVMPLFERTLRMAMKQGLRHDRIPEVTLQIIQALEFAHGHDIFHRDLKPENILCNADLSCVVLADFGIAHFGADVLLSAIETGNQERLANFAYAAPEQRVRGSEIGAPTDIWALGLILNELFTGQLILGKGHPLIESVAPEFARLDSLVELMLRQSPAERPTIGNVKSHFATPSAPTMNMETNVPLQPNSVLGMELRCSSPDSIWLHIERHPLQPGLIFDITNRRTKNISGCAVYLTEARSFDRVSGAYRDSFGLRKRRLSVYKEILAGDVTTPNWLLRPTSGHLEAGDTTGEGVLVWPKGDASSAELWALDLMVEAVGLEPWPLCITVEWQRDANLLSVSQGVSRSAATV